MGPDPRVRTEPGGRPTEEEHRCRSKRPTTKSGSSSRSARRGYLLYGEVNELLPPDIAASDELDELFTTFGNAGIEVVDSEQTYREHTLLDRRSEDRTTSSWI